MGKDILENKRVAIIGFGNMGQAIAKGLLHHRVTLPEHIITTKSNKENTYAVTNAHVVILCVKPHIMTAVLNKIKCLNMTDKLIISVAAGISIDTIEKYLGKRAKIVRVMPNLCARAGESMSCWVKNKQITLSDVNIIKSLLKSFGKEIEMRCENDLNKATAVSGSGPAYFFYFVEAFVESARRLGLNNEMSKLLVMQTIKGSLITLTRSAKSVEESRKQVTSKGGTTEAALKILTDDKFKEVFYKATHAAYNRSLELNFS